MRSKDTDWHSHFEYREDDLYWLNTGTGRPKRKNGLVGSKIKHGYRQAHLSDGSYLVHRIIWEMFNGPIPSEMTVDHKDRNPENNNINNLRLATMQQQTRNSRAKGFYWDKRGKKFVAEIRVDGRSIKLGYFNNELDARAEYLRARKRHFKEFS